jgi:hypothetical protein
MSVLSDFHGTLPTSLVGGEPALVREIQDALAAQGYLDPPSDGRFGQVTRWALDQFCHKNGLSLGAGFTRTIAETLLNPRVHLPAFDLASHWIGRAITLAEAQGYWFSRHPDCWNILYVEGVNPNGSVNNDAPNKFNDVRVVFRADPVGRLTVNVWEGTTEPGTYWTMNPMNPNGAARIAFGQYKAWRVGIHNSNHEALVQVEPVSVHRDLNQDFLRQGDAIFTGLFGINQHWGYDLPKDDLGSSSAGCLVGRTKSGHRDFMRMLKADARFMANPGYKFMTAIVPGDQI